MLELLPLCLGGDRYATSEDHIDLHHMLITVRIISTMLTPMGILRCRRCWWRHLLVIHKSLTLLQIISCGAMDLTPVFCIVRTPEGSLLLLLRGLLAAISVVSSVLVISPIGYVDLPIVLLP
jgi:hypothetical protein